MWLFVPDKYALYPLPHGFTPQFGKNNELYTGNSKYSTSVCCSSTLYNGWSTQLYPLLSLSTSNFSSSVGVSRVHTNSSFCVSSISFFKNVIINSSVADICVKSEPTSNSNGTSSSSAAVIKNSILGSELLLPLFIRDKYPGRLPELISNSPNFLFCLLRR